ncbi:GntR family transcriptional regulator [Actinacidiphila soli]|jgi:DNA-binding GntR family transcriptional regulator|uniref:GntR family transcriptional regulator n=1 Tax=Actinacidiphila soli TaxID=2487275 RepID=UPI0019CFE133|nr:GntR family transcriptional regulator [Actinacidiphila soli]
MDVMTLPALTSHSLADQAYRALRAAIIGGDLRWGAKITERGLAASLGVSPTPVREALRRLEQEQLVERTGPRSLRVATVSPKARTESGIIEAALEGVAARFAAEKATERQLAELERLLDTADEAAFLLRADRDAGRTLNPVQVERIFDAVRTFHAGVEAAADNAQLARALEQVRAFSRNERLSIASAQLAVSSPGQLRRYGQHREILAAVRDGDPERAEQLARTHAASAAADLAGWDA